MNMDYSKASKSKKKIIDQIAMHTEIGHLKELKELRMEAKGIKSKVDEPWMEETKEDKFFKRLFSTISPLDMKDKMANHWENGLKKGHSSGWKGFDEFFMVSKGRLNIVTGIPSHGKSEFLDALMVNMVANHNWKFGIFSPENFPIEYHIQKIMEKLTGVPFFGLGRIPKADMEERLVAMGKSFFFFCPDNQMTSRDLLAYTETVIEVRNIDAVIIDPWNEIEHKRPYGMSETEYTSETLSLFRGFARKFNIAVFLVAHPTKLQRDKEGNYPVPTPYDISGSAHWYNKADNCLTVWREESHVTVFVQKIRFKQDGKKGSLDFTYNIKTGIYTEIEKQEDKKWI